jgi:hypothetical protein
MNEKKIKKAIALAKKAGHVFLATSDADGMPHITAAGKLEYADTNHVAVTEWFCPGTTANLRVNKHISIVVWDKESDTGYQLPGLWDRIDDLEILDGFAPELESELPLPQVEKRLLVRIEKILDFKLAPHTDKEG